MQNDRPTDDTGKDEAEFEEAIAAIIANTRRVRRRLDLVGIAEYIAKAREHLGSLAAVADMVGLSEQMLRDFLSVGRLVPEVRRLVEQRRVDAVDVAMRISRMPEEDQRALAEAVMQRRLDADDVRAVLDLRRTARDAGVASLIQRIEESRNVKEYLAEFLVPSDGLDAESLRVRLAEVVGADNVRSLTLQGRVGVLAMDPEGRRRLAKAARQRGLTKRELLEAAVAGVIP